MSLATFILFLETQHVSDINMPVFRNLRLCCWTTTLAVTFLRCASAGSPDTKPAEPHPDSITQQSQNNTANVVLQQHSRKLLKMDILMPETCWVSKNEMNVTSDNSWFFILQKKLKFIYVIGKWCWEFGRPPKPTAASRVTITAMLSSVLATVCGTPGAARSRISASLIRRTAVANVACRVHISFRGSACISVHVGDMRARYRMHVDCRAHSLQNYCPSVLVMSRSWAVPTAVGRHM